MPTALVVGPYRFFFGSYDCVEPRHIHVQREGRRAKFWLDPVSLVDSRGFRARELREIERIIMNNLELLRPFRKINDPLVGPAFREGAMGVLDDETVAGPFPECGWILIFLE